MQVLRGMAACAVVFHHAYGVDHPAVGASRLGAAGVDLFFVISGFIMATVAADRQPLAFLRERAWRIYPMWLIALGPWLVLRKPGLMAAAANVTLWPIYGNAFHIPELHVGWTLSFEMLFYVAFALGLATRPVVPLLGLFACAVIPNGGNAVLGFLGSPLVAEFLFGIIIAHLPRYERAGSIAILAGLAWFAVAPTDYFAIQMGAAAWLRVMYWGLPAALLVYGAITLELHFRSKNYDLLVFLGNASYSIYLFHMMIRVNHSWVDSMVASIVLGCLAYWFVEKPLLRMGKSIRLRPIEPRSVTLLDEEGLAAPAFHLDLRVQEQP